MSSVRAMIFTSYLIADAYDMVVFRVHPCYVGVGFKVQVRSRKGRV